MKYDLKASVLLAFLFIFLRIKMSLKKKRAL